MKNTLSLNPKEHNPKKHISITAAKWKDALFRTLGEEKCVGVNWIDIMDENTGEILEQESFFWGAIILKLWIFSHEVGEINAHCVVVPNRYSPYDITEADCYKAYARILID